MAPLSRVFAAAALLLVPAIAQTDTDNSKQDVKVWAAVAFVHHGEKTPEGGAVDAVLTPVGAQEMLRQGEAFRRRYLSGSSGGNSSETDVMGSAPIEGIERDSLDNSQLALYSQSDEWASASAMAFLQGLYPPAKDEFRTDAGGSDLTNDLIYDRTADYPLNGYQYPKLLTTSSSDPNSAIIQGTVGCASWETQMNNNLTKREDLVNLAQESQSFYDDLFSKSPLEGTMDSKDINFWNAFNVYKLVGYLFRHNETVFKNLENANQTFITLNSYATQLERAKTSNAVARVDDPINTVYTVAGRTLGMHILNQLSNAILSNAERNKLTLMFGTSRPMTSLFSLMGLLTRENTLSGPLSRIPETGSAMIIELISDDVAGGIPEENKLQVRFYYRAGPEDNDELNLYSLYGSGNGGFSIPYNTFKTRMESDGLTPGQWCGICSAASSVSPWCFNGTSGYSGSSGNSATGSSSGLSRTASGAIGAVVMAGVIGLVFALLFGVLGFRLRRDHPQQRSTGLGGFKGAEKMASDPDLATPKGGAAQERIGSWEMGNDGHGAQAGGAGIITRDFSRHNGRRADEDGISFVGATPVRAHESV
ncbi:hypothetical protein HJFPF1_00422 [Paramyrothecium foliicola]|nr:hypothetical protein HJFPF1_00422 [Paramyrothecium foliicola]